MAITSNDGYIASTKQILQWFRSGARTTIAAQYFSLFDLAGAPGAGTLAGTSVAAGVVPTDATAGYPSVTAFAGGATGYLSRVVFGSTVACRLALFDRLWLGGAYAFNATQTLSAQPSYSGRVPNSDYSGLEIWLEQVTAGTLVQNVAVTYTNQAGTTGRTTGTFATAANTVGRCWQLPLQAGDTGVQKIESVTGTVASAGTFNIMVLRPLASYRASSPNDGLLADYLSTGLPIVYDTSAFYALVATDSTASGVPELSLEIASA